MSVTEPVASADLYVSPPRDTGFTRAQERVMHLLGIGKSNKEVAAIVGCSQRTVEIHALRIREKAGIRGGRAAFGAWYAQAFPERLGIPVNRELTPLQADATLVLHALQGVMQRDPRAITMARVLLERHAAELQS